MTGEADEPGHGNPEVAKEERDALREYANCVGHAIGRERKGGEYTGEVCVIAYVSQKLPEEELADGDILPDELCGCKVDVQQASGPARPPATGDPDEYVPRGNRDGEIRPWAGGIEIEGEEGGLGTGGSGLLECNGQRGFVSNYHVVCDGEAECTGEPIYQPGGGSQVGEVVELGQLDADASSSEEDQNNDFAFVSLDEVSVDATNRLYGLAEVTGFTEPNFEERYVKTGARTGFSSGLLDARDVTIEVDYDWSTVTITGADKYLTNVAPGDSGGVIGQAHPDGSFEMSGLVFAMHYEGDAHPDSPAYYAHPVEQLEEEYGFALDPVEDDTEAPDGGPGESFIEVTARRTLHDNDSGTLHITGFASNTGGTDDGAAEATVELVDPDGSTLDTTTLSVPSGEYASFDLAASDSYSSDILHLETYQDGSLVDDDRILYDSYEPVPTLSIEEATGAEVGQEVEVEVALENHNSEATIEEQVTLDAGGSQVARRWITVGPGETETGTLSYYPKPEEAGTQDVEVALADGGDESESTQVDITHPRGYYLYIYEPGDDPTAAPEEATVAGELESINPVREHTAISDWEASMPENPALEEWVLAEVLIYYGDEFLFHGFLESVVTDEGAAETTVSGRGVGKALLDGETELTFSDVETWEAIQQTWEDIPGWEADVQEPDADTEEEPVVLQSASTTEEWQDIVDIPETEPFTIEDGELKTLKSAYWLEASDTSVSTNASYYEWEYAHAGATRQIDGDSIQILFTDFEPEYTMPGSEEVLWLSFRIKVGSEDFRDPGNWGFEIYVDGNRVGGYSDGWSSSITDENDYRWYYDRIEFDLEGGEQHTILFEAQDAEEERADCWLDCVVIEDARYNYDISPDSEDLDYDDKTFPYPQSYPDAATLELNQVETNLNILEGNISSTWNDIEGEQALGLTIDGGTTWDSELNTDTLSVDYTDVASTTIRPRVTAGRHTVEQDEPETPTTGNAPQAISDWELSILGDNLAVIEDQNYTGDYLKILQELHEFANMRFTILHQEDGSRVAESYGAGQEPRERTWHPENRTREVDASGYKNRIVVRGARKDDGSGERYRGEAKAEGAIEALGEYSLVVTDPSLRTDDDCESKARGLLDERMSEGSLTGSHEITPQLVDPGYRYPIEEWGTILSLERVSYQEEFGDASGQLDFIGAEGLAGEITSLKGDSMSLRENL